MKDQSVDKGKNQLKSKSSVTAKQSFTRGFLKTDVVFVDQNIPLIEVAKIMKLRKVGDVIVTKSINQKVKPVGIITDRDLVVGVLADKKSIETMCASDLMAQPITIAYDTDGIYDMIKTMKKEGIGRLPIVDEEGTLLGIITAKKLLQLLAQEFNDLINFSQKSTSKELAVKH